MTGRELLAWNLRRIRSEQSLSQEQLAADTGVDRAYLSEIERGLGNATLDLMDRLAGRLGVRPGELLAEHSTPGASDPASEAGQAPGRLPGLRRGRKTAPGH